MIRRVLALFYPLMLIVALFGGIVAQEPRKGRKVALLVGVNDYSKSGLTNLKYCENDVMTLAEVLKLQGYKEAGMIILTDTMAAKKAKLQALPTAENIRTELQ